MERAEPHRDNLITKSEGELPRTRPTTASQPSQATLTAARAPRQTSNHFRPLLRFPLETTRANTIRETRVLNIPPRDKDSTRLEAIITMKKAISANMTYILY